MKDIIKIIATLLPIGIKLFKDIKNAKDKNEKKQMRERLVESRGHYADIRSKLIGK